MFFIERDAKMGNAKKILLHIKALVWCLHRVCQKYNLELIIESLKHGKVHPEIFKTNLGENVQYIIDNLDKKDIPELIKSLRDVNKRRMNLLNLTKEDDEIGYYIKSTEQIEELPPQSYGIVIKKNNDLEILFFNNDVGLVTKDVEKSQIEIVSGTFPE